uniref:Uncharacterized protein n=1 Tax=Calidris pygmaea TaxID=425635 RepID=A0A8C3KFR4_9CHAR
HGAAGFYREGRSGCATPATPPSFPCVHRHRAWEKQISSGSHPPQNERGLGFLCCFLEENGGEQSWEHPSVNSSPGISAAGHFGGVAGGWSLLTWTWTSLCYPRLHPLPSPLPQRTWKEMPILKKSSYFFFCGLGNKFCRAESETVALRWIVWPGSEK